MRAEEPTAVGFAHRQEPPGPEVCGAPGSIAIAVREEYLSRTQIRL
jgi:hypothetical protein